MRQIRGFLRYVPASAGVFALALAAGACGDDGGGGDGQLIDVGVIEPGDECPSGGVSITWGDDANGDGTLSDDEITRSEVVCDGQGAAGSTLVETEELGQGDPDCPFGGIRITVGTDDGDGGGTAGDGVLQEGEIDTSEVICNGDPGVDLAPIDPPEGPAGQFTIDLSGGDGTATCGGAGGTLDLGLGGALRGGHVKVFSTGVVDASFTLPAIETDLGELPLEVTGDLELTALPDADCNGVPDAVGGLAAGDVFQIDCASAASNEQRLWSWDGASAEAITGLHVAADATLTVASTDATTSLTFLGDILNEGTITVAPNEEPARRLTLAAHTYRGTADSVLDVRGVPEGAPSTLRIEAQLVVNEGAVEGDGADGQTGADIAMASATGVWNTGPVRASGGASTTAAVGGGGGRIRMEGNPVHNSGPVTNRGATGASSGGGGGTAVFFGGPRGVRNSGTIDLRAGDAASCDPDQDCDGGSSAGVGAAFVAFGPVRNAGDVVVRGGDGSGLGDGGNGGQVILSVLGGAPATAAVMSGNIDARGGSGAIGGSGGGVESVVNTEEVGAEIVLYGYTDIGASGGASTGACNGGNGGVLTLANGCPGPDFVAGGALVVANVVANGGDAVGGNGGPGGVLLVTTCDAPEGGIFRGGNVAVVRGQVELRGGSSDTSAGGVGGPLILRAHERIERTGDVDLRGGDGKDGGQGGSFIAAILDNREVSSTGAVQMSGGQGKGGGTGGFGGNAALAGGVVIHDGPVTAVGGDSPGGVGGDGGSIELLSSQALSIVSGALDAAGGSGATPGADGVVRIDDVVQ